MLLFAFPNGNIRRLLDLRENAWVWLAVALPAATSVAWWAIRTKWGLHEEILGSDSFGRAVKRINADDLGLIFRALALQNSVLYVTGTWLLAAAVGAIFRVRVSLLRNSFALAVGLLYVLGIVFVYLATPYSLSWHLETSADRVMLVPCLAIVDS